MTAIGGSVNPAYGTMQRAVSWQVRPRSATVSNMAGRALPIWGIHLRPGDFGDANLQHGPGAIVQSVETYPVIDGSALSAVITSERIEEARGTHLRFVLW
jgi:hypothetical protein